MYLKNKAVPIGVTWGGGVQVEANAPPNIFFYLRIFFVATKLKSEK
jgi:hypothetical protein